MIETSIKSLRLIIQRRNTEVEPSYRVIIYGNCDLHRHTDFTDGQALVEAIRLAIPGFDISRLSLNTSENEVEAIVFAESVNLDDLQLGILGLD